MYISMDLNLWSSAFVNIRKVWRIFWIVKVEDGKRHNFWQKGVLWDIDYSKLMLQVYFFKIVKKAQNITINLDGSKQQVSLTRQNSICQLQW